jgi:head-tail adaptor
MLAYRLKYEIEVWENVKAKNAIGSVTETPQLITTARADVQTAMGKVVANDDRVIHTTDTTFIIRNWPAITYNHFIKYEGQEYQVVAIQPMPDRTGQIIKTVRNG